MKKAVAYTILFILSFLFFVYTTFPYTIAKEALVNKISKATSLQISVRDLGPILPLGFSLGNVEVKVAGEEKGIEIEKLDVAMTLWKLLLLQLAVDIEMEDKNGGVFDLSGAMGIIDLIGGSFFPKAIELKAEQFDIGPFATFGLGKGKEAMRHQAMVADLIEKFGVSGLLTGNVDLALDASNIANSKGEVHLNLKKGVLKIDPSLGMADQAFEKALVKAQLKSGRLTIDGRSGIKSQGLLLDIGGGINLRQNPMQSLLNMTMTVKLDRGLKDQFGFVIDSALGGRNGTLNYKISGALGQPIFSKL